MFICQDCLEKDTYEVQETLPKKNAKKCQSCGKLRSAIYEVKGEEKAVAKKATKAKAAKKEDTKATKTKAKKATTKKAASKAAPKAKKTTKSKAKKTTGVNDWVSVFEGISNDKSKEMIEWLKREEGAIVSEGRDYWVDNGIFYFFSDEEGIKVLFNGQPLTAEMLASAIG